jgi:hypothetical protein
MNDLMLVGGTGIPGKEKPQRSGISVVYRAGVAYGIFPVRGNRELRPETFAPVPAYARHNADPARIAHGRAAFAKNDNPVAGQGKNGGNTEIVIPVFSGFKKRCSHYFAPWIFRLVQEPGWVSNESRKMFRILPFLSARRSETGVSEQLCFPAKQYLPIYLVIFHIVGQDSSFVKLN